MNRRRSHGFDDDVKSHRSLRCAVSRRAPLWKNSSSGATQVDTVLDETPISAAVTYARNQRVALQRFLDDGRLPLHNNISELNLAGKSSGAATGSSSAATTAR